MKQDMPHSRFVIQQHEMPDGIHWDLMLEKGDKLWTWRIDIHPAHMHQAVTAERIFDHPLKFLTYEGPVQNGTGNVVLTDKGRLCFHDIDGETILFSLYGSLVNGRFALHLENPPLWTFAPAED